MASNKSAVEKRLFPYDDSSDYDDHDVEDVPAVVPTALPSTSSCKFEDLPPELHSTIIDVLRDNISTKAKSRKVSRVSKPHDVKKCTLVHPSEDKRRQLRAEFVQNLAKWSSTSQFFRRLLVPDIYKTVHLTNDDDSGSSAAALSESLHNKYVKELVFKGKAYISEPFQPSPLASSSVMASALASLAYIPGIDTRYSRPSTVLPTIVSSVLSNLKRFPNLDTISIELPYDPTVTDLEAVGEETDEVVISAEGKLAWRALAAKTWEALIQNKDINLKTLEICRIGHAKISTFSKSAFRQFLTQIEFFELSMWGMNGSNTLANFLPFMSMLDVYFFDNLISTTNFVLKAAIEGHLGPEGLHLAGPLKLKGDQMPNVTTVFLKYIIICPELIDFLVGHEKKLKSLSLHKCSASRTSAIKTSIPWKDLFDCLYNSKFEKFRHLEVLYTHMPLTSHEEYPDRLFDDESDDEEDLEEIKQARLIYKQDEHLRIFPYTFLGAGNGTRYADTVENLRAFQRGEDQASYDRLMDKLKTNANKSG